jgi:hypothetical protein
MSLIGAWFIGLFIMIGIGLINILLSLAFGVHYFFADFMGSEMEVALLVGLGPLIALIVVAAPVFLLSLWLKRSVVPADLALDPAAQPEPQPNSENTKPAKKFWKCTGCGSVMTKKEGVQLAALLGGVSVSGGETCAICRKRHDAAGIYSGRYDFQCDDSVIEQMLRDPSNARGDADSKTWEYKGQIIR